MAIATTDTIADEDLVVRFRTDRDRRAFAELLTRFRPVFGALASKFFLPGADRDDVEQEILIGFTKAVRDFDPQNGLAFASFARGCVKRHLITSIRNANRNKHQALTQAHRLDAPVDGVDEGAATFGDQLAGEADDPAVALARRDEFEMLGAILGIGVSPHQLELLLARLDTDHVPEVASRLVATGDGSSGTALTLAEAEVLLYRMLEVPYVEVAQRMSKDAKYVDNCFQRVRRKAREALRQTREATNV